MTGPLDNVELLALAWGLGMAFLLLVAVIETVASGSVLTVADIRQSIGTYGRPSRLIESVGWARGATQLQPRSMSGIGLRPRSMAGWGIRTNTAALSFETF
jgi:hypothetical protein